MRCLQARKRLKSLSNPAGLGDELRRHLEQCPRCARWYQAEVLLNRDLAASTVDDTDDGLDWTTLKARVTARAGFANSSQPKENSIMSSIFHRARTRPRMSLTLAAVVVLIVAAAVVPFKMQQTVGYEVAIAGVQPELALDTDRLHTLLAKIGAEQADFEVGDCEATCKVTISRLEDEGQVQLVMEAFDEMGNCKIDSVIELKGASNATFFGHAKHIIEIKTDKLDSGEIEARIRADLAELHGDSTGEFTVWVSDDGTVEGEATIEVTTVSGGAWQATTAGSDTGLEQMVNVTVNDDGQMVIETTNPDGEVMILDPNDPETAEILEELGLNVMFLSTDSTLTATVEREVDLPSAAKAGSTLPAEYSLSQNYPNPFNPNTQIDFTLPQSENVRLDIYNMNGQLVRTLVDRTMTAGTHTVEWDGLANDGGKVSSGVYLYRLTAGDWTDSKKMSLVK